MKCSEDDACERRISRRKSVEIKRYYPESPILRPLIKYFWVSDSYGNIDMNHKILPMANIDLILNLSSPISYERNGKTSSTPGNIFFSGLTNKHMMMKQRGRIRLIGASFFPAGFYPFFEIPVSEFKNISVGLDQLLGRGASELEERIHEAGSLTGKLKILEAFLLSRLDRDACRLDDDGKLIRGFTTTALDIGTFCKNFGIHHRTLERRVNRYVGTSPKQFQRLQRFQSALNRLTTMPPRNLTGLAHEFDYYDQTHFIKDFKAFTGTPPSLFLKERQAFMQIMKVS